MDIVEGLMRFICIFFFFYKINIKYFRWGKGIIDILNGINIKYRVC